MTAGQDARALYRATEQVLEAGAGPSGLGLALFEALTDPETRRIYMENDGSAPASQEVRDAQLFLLLWGYGLRISEDSAGFGNVVAPTKLEPLLKAYVDAEPAHQDTLREALISASLRFVREVQLDAVFYSLTAISSKTWKKLSQMLAGQIAITDASRSGERHGWKSQASDPWMRLGYVIRCLDEGLGLEADRREAATEQSSAPTGDGRQSPKPAPNSSTSSATIKWSRP